MQPLDELRFKRLEEEVAGLCQTIEAQTALIELTSVAISDLYARIADLEGK